MHTYAGSRNYKRVTEDGATRTIERIAAGRSMVRSSSVTRVSEDGATIDTPVVATACSRLLAGRIERSTMGVLTDEACE